MLHQLDIYVVYKLIRAVRYNIRLAAPYIAPYTWQCIVYSRRIYDVPYKPSEGTG